MKHRMVATGCNEFNSSKTKLRIKSPLCCNPWLLEPLIFGSAWVRMTAQTEVLRGFTQYLQATTVTVLVPSPHIGTDVNWFTHVLQDAIAVLEPLKAQPKSRPCPHIKGVCGE